MADILLGEPVAQALCETLRPRVDALRAQGVVPMLAILRVGERPEDLIYERSAKRRCASLGIEVRSVVLPQDVKRPELKRAILSLNYDKNVHGVLLLRPLPSRADDIAACAAIEPAKDVDGVTAASQAKVFSGTGSGFSSCTAQACIEILRHYGVPINGSRAVVVGRGMAAGKPAAMLLLQENATVTLCHSLTRELASEVRRAEIVVSAVGRAGLLGEDCVSPEQVILDVGFSQDASGAIAGDADKKASGRARAVTPVPGGVGAVTTAVLASHVIQAAEKAAGARPPAPARMRIGIFIDTYFPMIDGVIMCVDNYARYLSRFADVTVFTTVVDRDFGDEHLPYRVVRCRSIPVPGEDYVLPAPALDREYWDELQCADLDIVHINSPFTVGASGARYARKHNVPMVATMHSQFQTDFRRALKMQPLVEFATDSIIRVFDEADEVWVPNSAVGKVYREYGGTKTPIVHSNATDMKPVEDRAGARERVNTRYGLTDDERVLLFVGRLVLQKNILFIADAIAALKKQTATPFRLLFVGAGPDEGELRARIAELGAEDRIVFTGRVTDREALAELYCRADLFLFPSLYDANSLVQIEAASQRTPTLFLRGAVTSATAEDGVSGYFADNNPEAYARKIAEIFAAPEEHAAVCQGAFRDIYRSWDQVISGMLEEYRRLIDSYRL